MVNLWGFRGLTPRPPLQRRGGDFPLGFTVEKAKGTRSPSPLERGPGGEAFKTHKKESKSKNRLTQIRCSIAQFLFDAEQLIVFGDPVRAGSRAGFDLSGIERYSQVGNGSIFRFAGTVADDRCVGVARG